MNLFAEIFDETASFLRTKDITVKVSKGSKAIPADIRHFQKQTGVELPESFSVFFTEFADGFEFFWQQREDVWGMFSIPNLKVLADERQKWIRNVRDFLDDPNGLDQCIQEPFRAQAFEVWRKMESWVPFWNEGNGDHFCVDSKNGQILYDQHDWLDGFGSLAKDNGILAGKSLEDFLRNWSRFCFRPNKSLWWGEFGEAGAVKWEPEYFDETFYRGS
jgi:hypothetical protein